MRFFMPKYLQKNSLYASCSFWRIYIERNELVIAQRSAAVKQNYFWKRENGNVVLNDNQGILINSTVHAISDEDVVRKKPIFRKVGLVFISCWHSAGEYLRNNSRWRQWRKDAMDGYLLFAKNICNLERRSRAPVCTFSNCVNKNRLTKITELKLTTDGRILRIRRSNCKLEFLRLRKRRWLVDPSYTLSTRDTCISWRI